MSFLINNSSHSITFEIESNAFCNAFDPFSSILNEKNFINTKELENSKRILSVENIKISSPEKKRDVIDSLIDLIERTIPIETEEILKTAVIASVLKYKKEIENDMKSVKYLNQTKSWDGDNDGFYPDECEEDVEKIKKIIANENNCDIEDITEETLRDYIMKKVLVVNTFFVYDIETEKEEYYQRFELE